MKNLLFAMLLLSVSNAFAQGFEGTMKWTMKTEITDPARKAQMEEAQKKMNDPAMKAQMEEAQKKMEDPQFKAMMDANPQMKEQMEKALAHLKSGNSFTAMFPTGMEIRIKDQNVITKIEGGAFANEVLYLKSKDQSYSIDRAKKTYSVLSQPEKADKPKSDVTSKVTRTSETAKVMNYNCVKYIVELQTSGQTLVQHIWTTTEIKDIDLTSLKKQRVGKDQSIFYEGMEGVPLKLEMSMQGMKVTSEVVDIKKQSLPAADFMIPAGFKEVPLAFRPQ